MGRPGARRPQEARSVPGLLRRVTVPFTPRVLLLRADPRPLRLLLRLRGRRGRLVRGGDRGVDRGDVRGRVGVRLRSGGEPQCAPCVRVRVQRPGVRQRRTDLPEPLPPPSGEQEGRARQGPLGHPHGEGPVRCRQETQLIFAFMLLAVAPSSSAR